MELSEIRENPGFRPNGLHPGYGFFARPLTGYRLQILSCKHIRLSTNILVVLATPPHRQYRWVAAVVSAIARATPATAPSTHP